MHSSTVEPLPNLPRRLHAWLERRGVPFVLTLAIEALMVLAVLSIGLAPEAPKLRTGARLTSFDMRSGAHDSKPAQARNTESARPALAAAQPRADQSQSTPREMQPQQMPAAAPPAFIPIPSNQMPAFNLANLPRQSAGPAPQKAQMGPAFAPLVGDSRRIGTAPGGQPLYAAAWYREPEDSELAGYLSTAEGPGYALIACRTVPDWRVEDCVTLDEYPSGSNIARAVLAAAWQFRVRPPRLGGVYKVGEWVRIRIDYERRPARL
ncbi:MAG: hypothetical protein U1E37_08090 [Sphingomonadaceae bacterium]